MRAALVSAVKRCIPPTLVRYRGPAHRPEVALTFDDGPIPLLTPQILQALREGGHTATFFLLGEETERHPEVVREILAAGCEVANHTQTHGRVHRLTPRQIDDQIEAADRSIQRAAGLTPRYFRPPGGELSAPLFRYLRRTRREAPVLWSRMIAREEERTAAEIEAELAERPLRPGDILLLHDDYPETARAVPGILRLLDLSGLRSVTLSRLLRP
jgi:peptidoglycan/xylan/chitin deacetylase (PgdA/CDA1 family)